MVSVLILGCLYEYGKPILLYSFPRGLDKAELDCSQSTPNTYKIFNFSTKPALVDSTIALNMDYSLETPYTAQRLQYHQMVIALVSWIRLPDVDYQPDKYDFKRIYRLG